MLQINEVNVNIDPMSAFFLVCTVVQECIAPILVPKLTDLEIEACDHVILQLDISTNFSFIQMCFCGMHVSGNFCGQSTLLDTTEGVSLS